MFYYQNNWTKLAKKALFGKCFLLNILFFSLCFTEVFNRCVGGGAVVSGSLGSPAKVRGQKTRFRSLSNSTAVLNLNCSLVFFFKSFSLYFFEKKYQKHGQLCPAFGASFAQESLCDIFQSVHTSPLAACRNAWGGKNSLRSNIMPPVSKHCSAARCASQRYPSALGGELLFAMKRRVE